MAKPQGTIRPIQYPLNRSADVQSELPDEQETYIDLSEWQTDDPDERVSVIMDLSLNEYVALATAVDVGRDIAYGDNSIYIWWLWTRILTAMDICGAVADCIENSEAVQTALQNNIAGNIQDSARPEQYQQFAFDESGEPSCDKDVIYGYCYALWQYIDRNNQDFLQQMAEATNYTEQIARFITLIPLADQLPVDEILGWVEAFGDYNLEAYNASITVGLEQQIICELFCIADENCSITKEQVWVHFVEKFGGFNLPTLTANFIEWVSFMALGQYPNDRVVYMWTLFQLFCAFAGAEFLGINSVRPYGLFAQAGEPDNEWSILCDPCNEEWTSVLDFSVSSYGFQFDTFSDGNVVGYYESGVGLRPSQNGGSLGDYKQLFGYLPFDTADITSIRLEGTFTEGYDNNQSASAGYFEARDGETTPYPASNHTWFYNEFPLQTQTPIDETTSGYEVSANRIYISLRPAATRQSGNALASKLTITGTGQKPSQLP